MRRLRPHLTYANVMSTLAVFLVLGGGAAYAANTIGSADVIDESLLSQDIKNAEVKVADIGQGAVATAEIIDSQVKAPDIGEGEVKVADIATGAVKTEELANGQVQAQDLAPGASGARAWGLVDVDGTLLRSKQITAVTNPLVGVYCIDPGPGIDPDSAVMVVGEDFGLNNTSTDTDNVSHVEWDSTPSRCPSARMEVATFVANGVPPSGQETDFGGFSLHEGDQPFTFVIP